MPVPMSATLQGTTIAIRLILISKPIACSFPRFTEELFATLIAFIFIFNAFKNISEIRHVQKFAPSNIIGEVGCQCLTDQDEVDQNVTKETCQAFNGTLTGPDCDFEANVFLMSVVLFVGAFFISITLKNFRSTGFLPGKIRHFMSDFAVIIAIFSMSAIDYAAKVKTPKLDVPDSFKPTWEGRDWAVTHALIFADHLLTNPWWVDVFLAPVLAILATILIFMDQQITAVIVNRKEFMLRKGGGYHLDLLVLAVIITVCSIFGLPWFVAATVLSINHIQSLTKESQASAPGEKPQFLGIREQRVTNVMIGVAIGLSTQITPILALIPMPVLYGVFLFMGVSSLKGLQFYERILLLFMPKKYQPDYIYLKYVPLSRVHLFTFVQLFSLITLWAIKSHPTTSIAFPVMLVVICAIRKIMECIFTKRELRLLDDLLPESDENVRKGNRQKLMIRQLSRKISKHNMVKEWNADDEETKEEVLKREKAMAKAALRKKAKELGLEVDAIMLKEAKFKSPNRGKSKLPVETMKLRRFSSDSRSETGLVRRRKSRSKSPPALNLTSPIKATWFIKMQDASAYFPIRMKRKTVHDLLHAVHLKCPSFQPESVAGIYHKNQRGMVFHLDDDMMEFIEGQPIFDIESAENTDVPGKFDITLCEVSS